MMTSQSHISKVRYGTERVGDLDIFYRESGDPEKTAHVSRCIVCIR